MRFEKRNNIIVKDEVMSKNNTRNNSTMEDKL